MSVVFKSVAAFIGLVILALFFPFVHQYFDVMAGNSTNPGVLYMEGVDALGNPIYVSNTTTTLLRWGPYFWPVAFFIAIILYVVVKRNKGSE